MHGAQLLLLVVGSIAVTAVARRRDLPAPLLLVVVGLAISFLPGADDYQLDPHILLGVVLPPLLYSASLDSSYLNFKAVAGPIVQLGVVLVVITAFLIGLAAHLLMPSLPWEVALLLGAVVAPPDAVAAVAIGRKLGLPRSAMTVLTGESLVNDASALTLYKVALAGVAGASTGLFSQLSTFVVAVVVGIAVGLVIGVVAHFARTHLDDTVLESVLGLVVPFACYLIAEEFEGSGVLAVVAAGLYLGHNSPKAGFATRLQEQSVWTTVDVLLESLVFGLIGLELPFVLRGVSGLDPWLTALALLAAVIVIRIVFVFSRHVILRLLRRPRPSWRVVAIVSWTGMRGVVTLAAAAGIPDWTPGWAYLQLVAFVITVGTLLLQGISLPWLIRGLGVHEEKDTAQEAQARKVAAKAAKAMLSELVPADIPVEQRKMFSQRMHAMMQARDRIIEQDPSQEGAITRVRREMLARQREVLVAERSAGRLDDEVMRKVMRELDLEEAMLTGTWRSRL
ncbi:Na+/H+ antiporter [Kutzneria buriramensis]|uniref:CPA1 family monovalent cation:H+ antiporter n=1 Tax=Kutzneria buriramensis TaxID=1045776 RepID=A0A3E0I8V6_9PSEU|nr:Na+/H+ antiporter [Kutzneria buriramensis]REH55059.1 CPA1 family monovalent cation:H+ antiporter [Kutzneria buriramensis]